MSLHDLPNSHENRVWSTVRTEVSEVAWLVAVVGALSVASVVLAAMLAAA
jgi:hypothetical protein